LKRKPVIGLVGGIGSGKSTVASLLAEAGAAVIDSDDLNRAQLQSKEVVEEIRSWWGESVCDSSGGLDRRRIAEIVFADPQRRRRLEQFVHPRIAQRRDRLMEAYQRTPSVVSIVLDTPLLIESQLDRRCDAIVFVDADDAVRLSRVTKIRGWTEDEWRRRENSQNALDNKRSRADYVVVNNSSDLDELRSSIRALLADLGISKQPTPAEPESEGSILRDSGLDDPDLSRPGDTR
jgi:dephospho-CoA kinase